RFIGRAGAGLDLIDLPACERRGIRVFAANEANRVAVAEHLLGMILNLFNRISTSGREIGQDQWLREKNRGEELQGKTVGIIGYGNNGSEAAARFAAFGCRVLVYDKYKAGFGSGSIEETGLDEIFRSADILSLHIPLTAETRGWIDADFFDRFAKPVYFCNVARGEIMKQGDLVAALRSGKVPGACLDVLENEKLSTLTTAQRDDFDFLKDHSRVILTPHVAGWTQESYRKINEVLCARIMELLAENR
ncbi:MAG: phosphoglycerate dehydrogenase, partial [Leadbetterella sp.]|nr:phosphoglycerate dehydrogenase [Leadbetterella sp.]